MSSISVLLDTINDWTELNWDSLGDSLGNKVKKCKQTSWRNETNKHK